MMQPAIETYNAKPFLKWAGGKGQLINQIKASLPNNISSVDNLTYIEPFVGSGAVMFWLLKTYPNIKRAIINDINHDLIIAYLTIKNEPELLIKSLKKIEDKYYAIKPIDKKKDFFLKQRSKFNARDLDSVERTTCLIFLNKTCFNGLYRVNSKNEFNVPFGRYERPNICDFETIIADSEILQKVDITHGEYSDTIQFASNNTLYYLDPPYKPISKTSSFNSYSKNNFDDMEQERLRDFCNILDKKKIKWILSNSDLKNKDTENEYFDELYKDFYIRRVPAKRFINANGNNRGCINELLITNFQQPVELVAAL